MCPELFSDIQYHLKVLFGRNTCGFSISPLWVATTPVPMGLVNDLCSKGTSLSLILLASRNAVDHYPCELKLKHL